ncbi:undecaprenyldiphospho-muramoylpentapeptide beta-N-acetylglucosaminyltransferase [Deinococcus sp. KNUC1210]|uniref:undecaprenyldiphospho-muramoylpentapeptide beta-N-acetylglucosaminyltransferase n=1 Tax=Deinococcus sp. KNUC1210 TaxID=2917691 RepID=UPI001EF023DD|nr:undecaprenyldiphospho-muramoylpentapeptide beta-N-acetylglucosaminyltransferase [Deinococcus sp. KNUC1210]ULH15555.1 undecaprenyldiphospho-muramoylpentapeptide beta-N-acetylglucosaminyltransferase [Deinococcus sp. KNUC1210]
MKRVVLSTGGTGGHIYPAVATAQELSRRGYGVTLLGQKGGMEERIAAEQNLEFFGVSAGKFSRSVSGLDPRQALKAARGLAQARGFLNRLKPGVVVGYGGFASLPGVLAAQSLGLPTVLHEQNARLGLTQRLALRRAQMVGTAYPQVAGLPPARAVMVGMPVREEWLLRQEAVQKLGLQEGPLTILVMGGSQGSVALNNTVPGILRELFSSAGLTPDDSVQVLHSTGPRWLADVTPQVQTLAWYKPVSYVDSVAAWSVADLAITRAGTGTLAEAAFFGVPVIMVPLPSSAEDHQRFNARAVQEAGAGRMVEQDFVNRDLGAAVLECLKKETRASMQEAALRRSPQGAASRLADLAERHFRS